MLRTEPLSMSTRAREANKQKTLVKVYSIVMDWGEEKRETLAQPDLSESPNGQPRTRNRPI